MLREDAGLSQIEMAERLGWTKARLCKCESNRLALPLGAISEIAEVLGTVPEAVMLRCLQELYPDLRSTDSKPARMLNNLVKELEKDARQ